MSSSKKKPKVLLLGWSLPPDIEGGLDIHVFNLFKELKSRDIDVSLALPSENAPEDKRDIISLESGEGDMIWKSREISSDFVKVAEEFDIVHTHDWFGAEAGFKAKKYSDVAWISTIHSTVEDRSQEFSKEIKKLEKLASEEPDYLITVSNSLQQKVNDIYNVKSKVIHNGFSNPSCSNLDVKEKHEVKGDLIMFVGRHAEQKGIEHLLYGFKKYLESTNDSATLLLGGTGHLQDSLKEFADILNMNDKVIFSGFIPFDELGDYYSAADVFVSPSRSEPFGLTITEALASQTPVVATENGVSEIISTDNIIEVDCSSESIKNGIENALNCKFVDDFVSRTWDDMCDEIMEVYDNTL